MNVDQALTLLPGSAPADDDCNGRRLRVFISWSGDQARKYAEALREWLPCVIQACQPFESSGDIEKGARWNDTIAHQLDVANFGIVCVTKDNATCPWLNYEAGALANAVGTKNVSPLLFSMERTELHDPLAQFQSTVFNKPDVFKLVYSLNERLCPDLRLSQEVLKKTFDRWWCDLDRKVQDADGKEFAASRFGYPAWLLTFEQVLFAKEAYRLHSIWIVTRRLSDYAGNPAFKRYLRTWLPQGVRFVFFDNDRNARELIDREFTELGKVPQYAIPIAKLKSIEDQSIEDQRVDNLFESAAATEYIIMNPDGSMVDSEALVYIRVPRDDKTDEWIEVDSTAVDSFVRRFQNIWQQCAPQDAPHFAKTFHPPKEVTSEAKPQPEQPE